MPIHLPWLAPGHPFPDVTLAWPPGSDAPGLLAAGADLDTRTLIEAYSQGIFPWYGDGQPVLWWSPDPRMVLQVHQFKLHRSLRKVIQAFTRDAGCEVRIDSAFSSVIHGCANRTRRGQNGTWIVPAMVHAYEALHRNGHAHSVETWVGGALVGGLYCVNIGGAVFGESMFSTRTDASKVALAALVCVCRHHGIRWIDCQQNTAHLATLGAAEMPRTQFISTLQKAMREAAPEWRFDPLYWGHILDN